MAFSSIADPRPPVALFSDADYAQQRAFFTERPALAPTPLRRLRGLARTLGLAELRVKDETARFGLNAFKAAGAMFAIERWAPARRDSRRAKPSSARAKEIMVARSRARREKPVPRACLSRRVGAAARIAAIESEAANRGARDGHVRRCRAGDDERCALA